MDTKYPILKKFDSNLFKNLVNLEYLFMENNCPYYLDSNLFAFNTKLRHLEFIDNKLDSLDPILFKNNLELENLDLRSNNLSYIKQGSLDHLCKLRYLYLGDF